MPSDKKKGSKVYTYYEIKEGKLSRRLPFCSRCGRGYFMADHGDRYSCGRCGFTRFKSPKERKR